MITAECPSLLPLHLLNPERIPKHIAIIPDGNRRWAKKNRTKTNEGHRAGANILMNIVEAASELGVKRLTFYCFSTENWERPQDEVSALMDLFASYLFSQKQTMIEKGVKLETIGDSSKLSPFLKEIIQETKIATESCEKIDLILAINYGARDEICRAFKRMLQDYDRGLFTKDDVGEEAISAYLDTKGWMDPDLLIRTSGEMRVSNFLLWQISYTEIYSTSVLWPDFKAEHLLEAILDYQKRERRWGGQG